MKKWIYILAICLVAVTVAVTLTNKDDDTKKDKASTQDKTPEITDTAVWIEVKDIVSDRLKSPSSAKFCTKSQATIKRSGDTWTVSGYVDADNSFGASIRNNFTVEITFTSDTDYTIDRCDITAR